MRELSLIAVLILAMGLRAQAAWIAGEDMALNEKPDEPDMFHDDTLNPNSLVPQWSYGYRFTLESTNLTLFATGDHTDGTTYADLEGFIGNGVSVLVNVGNAPIVINNGPGPLADLNPGEMHLHPSPDNAYAIVRWTSPLGGDFDLSAYWYDQDPYGGNGASAHILVNGVLLFDEAFNNGGGTSTVQTVSLNVGDVVDFALGSRGDFSYDGTRFDASVGAAVPEPSALGAFLAACAVAWRMRRRGA
ncbi:MAG: PEP-CTERM sorting domain-containing protein [Verrucomicrobiae bacterium]|nr:PEP-CTERM sorting domain-containing protein [Verrucomicrobiae bacterium]